MAYNVVFEDEFQKKVKSILNFYIYECQQEGYAHKIVELIYTNVVERIELNPYLYPSVLGKKNIRKALLIDIKYKIYYSINEHEKMIYIFDIESFRQGQSRDVK